VGVNDTRRRTNFAVGFLCSVVLHGLILSPFVLERHRAVTNIVIPVEVVVLADQTANSEYAPQKGSRAWMRGYQKAMEARRAPRR
jgi:hypothetical protein